MEYIPGNDKWLDPPDEPTHGYCEECGDLFDYSDLNERGDYYYCDECVKEHDAESAREDNDE